MKLSRPLVGAALASAVAISLVTAGAHAAPGQIGPATTFAMTVHQDGSVVAPTDGNAVPNIDSVKSTLRAYYGATKQADPAYGLPGSTAPATTYLPNLVDSAYAKNTKAIATALQAALPAAGGPGQAVVFDVDSTLLSDYGNEEDMNFNYNSALNGIWVNNALMPAVPGMPGLLQYLHNQGYTIYAITGRPASQQAATLTNLAGAGYTTDGTPSGTPLIDTSHLYTKDVANQPWVDCTLDGNPACSTVEYKALTRQHIESAGFTIDMNVGDQWSDLEGGHAAATQKMPNPSYFLPSADIPGAPAGDAGMVLPSSYTMAPDGSTGATATDGDKLPNEGAVVSEIRAYYGADSTGVANKTASPYISQLTSLEASWTPEVVNACKTGADAAAKATTAQTNALAAVAFSARVAAKARKVERKAERVVRRAHGKAAKRAATRHTRLKAKKRAVRIAEATQAQLQNIADSIHAPAKPAVVFDADDTTLWNYDLEDSVMHFNYDPTVSATWVSGQKFPAVPGMPALAKAVAAAGCTIVGITGRPGDQQADTIANLTKDGYVDAAGQPLFTTANYYTKAAVAPSYLDCGDDAKCSTIEYKGGTREYLETQKSLDIVANFGDQFSDLHGGYADKTYKVPNPTYYLP